ncbi:class I SAM-dependent methyltransferase [Rhodobacteraceae bacterium NNCM2]|nr:class I SAM-dependent methyltransferase [Coraliihabitans acroporae]
MADAQDWAGELGAKWATQIEPMDRMLEPVTEHAIAALAPMAGERVIDLGCGGGPTSLRIAEAVGPEGAVLGVDISPDLLEIARARGAGMAQLGFANADAGSHDFGGAVWDALFSRFGCMFFSDPVAAMANLRSAVKPGGRAVLTVWAEPKFNPWAMLPARAAAEILGPAEKIPPGAPGPFGWATPEIFMPILEGAGWQDIAFVERDLDLPLSRSGAEDPVAEALDHACEVGPLARRLREAPDAEGQIRPILARAFAPLVRDGIVWVGGRIRIISATA